MRRRTPPIASLALLLTLPAASSVRSATIRVEPDGIGDYPDNQTALDRANPDDLILLGDGVFQGARSRNLSDRGKPLIVRSENGNPFRVHDRLPVCRTRILLR